ESEENLRTTIRELFRNLPKVKNLDDQAGMKGVHEAIDSVITLATEAGLEKETLSLALKKLTKPVTFGFFREYKSKQLKDLSTYLKEQAKFIDWYNEFAGEEGTARKDTSSKSDDKKQTWSKNKQFRKQGGQKQVNAISIKAESDSESDEDRKSTR